MPVKIMGFYNLRVPGFWRDTGSQRFHDHWLRRSGNTVANPARAAASLSKGNNKISSIGRGMDRHPKGSECLWKNNKTAKTFTIFTDSQETTRPPWTKAIQQTADTKQPTARSLTSSSR